MSNEELLKYVMTLFDDFLFRKGFFDYFYIMQKEGIEAARRFWDSYPFKTAVKPDVLDIYEIMIDFYLSFGLMPKGHYELLLKEQEKLSFENTFLWDTFKQLQLHLFVEGGIRAQEAWNRTIDKQIESHRGILRNIAEFLQQWRNVLYGERTEESCNTPEARRERRYGVEHPAEFSLSDEADNALRCVIVNISNSGLCIKSPSPVVTGQRIIITSSLPMRHKTYVVRWNNASMCGLSHTLS